MKNRLFGICAALLFPLAGKAQSRGEIGVPKYSIKTNVSAFVNPLRPAITIGSDYFINPRWSVDASLGWFFGTALQFNRGETFNGLRSRFGMKYLFAGRRVTTPYIGCEVKYHFIREKNYETIQRAGGQYNETMLLGFNRNVTGLAFRGGAHFCAGPKRNFLIDLFAGIGYRYTHIKSDPIPEDATIPFFNQFGFGGGPVHWPDLLFGVNLGYLRRQ